MSDSHKVYVRDDDEPHHEVFSGMITEFDGPMDLRPAVKVESRIRKNGGPYEPFDIDLDLETSHYKTPPLDVSVVGTVYEFDMTITWPDDKIETIPSMGMARIEVVDGGDLSKPAPQRSKIESPADFLRRMAPTQTHEGRRAFLAAADELESWQPRPGEMHEVDKAFYDLAIKERNFERTKVDRLEGEIARLRGGGS